MTQDHNGIHVEFDEPLELGGLGPILNRRAEQTCAKVTVQDPTVTQAKIIAYDSKGLVQFRFGHSEAMVAPLFDFLAQKSA